MIVPVSIILPVYNADKYLEVCLNSIVSQTFSSWELIAIDDGSTDTSAAILDRYAANDSRIRVIHKANGGTWAARNDALNIACGVWVTFIDNDDLYAPYWLEEAMRVAAVDCPDVILQDKITGNLPPRGFSEKPIVKVHQTFTGHDAAKWYWESYAHSGFVWIWFVRREILGNIRFRPVMNCKEDGIWLLELAPRIKRASYNGYQGYFWRNTVTSLSKKVRRSEQSVAYLKALFDIWKEQRSLWEQHGIVSVVSQLIRSAADHDVIEWVERGEAGDDAKGVYMAYRQLLDDGALEGKWTERGFYWLAFWLWRNTRWLWPLKSVAKLLDFLRNVIRRLRWIMK